MKQLLLLLTVSCVFFASCNKKETSNLTRSGLNPIQFVSVSDDKQKTQLYTMTNSNGMEVCVVNTGMRIVSIMVPDKNGAMTDVVLGFDKIDPYFDGNNVYGATLGRFANRIANGSFQLDRVTYTLRKKANDQHAIHGGPNGFHVQYFKIEQVDNSQLRGTYFSKSKEEGFLGDLSLTVIYTLTDDNALHIEYEAQTNMPTVVNFTNHSYFNLSGDLAQTVLDHQLFIDANNYTPTDATLIPTGKISPVINTPLDFTQPTAIGDRINDNSCESIQFADGYDLNYVLNHPDSIENMAAKVYSPTSGISLEVYTTEPGIQLYTANHMNYTGKFGKVYTDHTAICLETQHFPDSPNHPEFPSTTLRPGDFFYSKTIYKFGIQK